MGEILVPEWSHLAADQDDTLGEHRKEELAEAMKILGVTDHRFLGGFGTYRDSGMAWHQDGHAVPGDVIHDNAFWKADLNEAADHLVRIVREVRPQVLVTYDEFGGYGHPDHIQAHRVAMYAAQLAGVPSYKLELGEPHEIAKVYWSAMSENRMRDSLRKIRESGDTETFEGMDPDGDMGPFVTPDELLTARIDGSAVIDRKMTALAAHRSQVQQDGFFFAGAESGHAFWAEEFFRLAKGSAGEVGDDGFEPDLFAGT
jgi:N-acetyl-1-D-myo-inositol-2-amino-2-deoxy-alpha-D-glucopyranoside deacetylase